MEAAVVLLTVAVAVLAVQLARSEAGLGSVC